MTIKIGNKEYKTVAERLQAIHEDLKDESFSIETELLTECLPAIVYKAKLTIGDRVFIGHSGANPEKAIEKKSPYEVAETSAVGRALGFAGYGLTDSVATADEIIKSDDLGF